VFKKRELKQTNKKTKQTKKPKKHPIIFDKFAKWLTFYSAENCDIAYEVTAVEN